MRTSSFWADCGSCEPYPCWAYSSTGGLAPWGMAWGQAAKPPWRCRGPSQRHEYVTVAGPLTELMSGAACSLRFDLRIVC